MAPLPSATGYMLPSAIGYAVGTLEAAITIPGRGVTDRLRPFLPGGAFFKIPGPEFARNRFELSIGIILLFYKKGIVDSLHKYFEDLAATPRVASATSALELRTQACTR